MYFRRFRSRAIRGKETGIINISREFARNRFQRFLRSRAHVRSNYQIGVKSLGIFTPIDEETYNRLLSLNIKRSVISHILLGNCENKSIFKEKNVKLKRIIKIEHTDQIIQSLVFYEENIKRQSIAYISKSIQYLKPSFYFPRDPTSYNLFYYYFPRTCSSVHFFLFSWKNNMPIKSTHGKWFMSQNNVAFRDL